MSNFYLCDVCAQKLDDNDHRNTCECWPIQGEHRKVPALDRGRDGYAYICGGVHDTPVGACPHFTTRDPKGREEI